jgi:hypothetical protein
MAVAVVLGLGCSAGSAQDCNDVPAIAVFGFQLINTSLERATAAEDQRIRMLYITPDARRDLFHAASATGSL